MSVHSLCRHGADSGLARVEREIQGNADNRQYPRKDDEEAVQRCFRSVVRERPDPALEALYKGSAPEVFLCPWVERSR